MSEPTSTERRHPWFKFAPKSWRGDDGLRACSPVARCLWLEILCTAHSAEPRGFLLINGRIPTNSEIAILAAMTTEQVRSGLAELERNGVLERGSGGVIYSRKMVRESAKSAVNSQNVTARWAAEKAQESPVRNTKVDTKPIRNGSLARDACAPDQNPEVRKRVLESDDSRRIADLLDAFNPREFGDDGDAWKMAIMLFEVRGGISEKRARPLIGRLAKEFELRPLEIAKASAATWKSATRHPEPYFRKVCAGLADDRSPFAPEAQEPESDLHRARREFERTNPVDAQLQVLTAYFIRGDWPSNWGPTPDEPDCLCNEFSTAKLRRDIAAEIQKRNAL